MQDHPAAHQSRERGISVRGWSASMVSQLLFIARHGGLLGVVLMAVGMFHQPGEDTCSGRSVSSSVSECLSVSDGLSLTYRKLYKNNREFHKNKRNLKPDYAGLPRWWWKKSCEVTYRSAQRFFMSQCVLLTGTHSHVIIWEEINGIPTVKGLAMVLVTLEKYALPAGFSFLGEARGSDAGEFSLSDHQVAHRYLRGGFAHDRMLTVCWTPNLTLELTGTEGRESVLVEPGIEYFDGEWTPGFGDQQISNTFGTIHWSTAYRHSIRLTLPNGILGVRANPALLDARTLTEIGKAQRNLVEI